MINIGLNPLFDPSISAITIDSLVLKEPLKESMIQFEKQKIPIPPSSTKHMRIICPVSENTVPTSSTDRPVTHTALTDMNKDDRSDLEDGFRYPK